MILRVGHPSDPLDPLCDEDLLGSPLPPPVSAKAFLALPRPQPPLLVDGILHQGCRMLLAGPSKTNKTWALLDMALSVASGEPWWGRKTTNARVLYVNFELEEWSMQLRLQALISARPELAPGLDNLQLNNLRGYATDLALLRPSLENTIAGGDYGLIIIDPAYKLLGDRDENSNTDITSFMNEFERLSAQTKAAVVIAHHFAKGNASVKSAADRMSGAGAWARDPDALLVMTPHEEDNCFTVSSILRCLPMQDDFVVEWDYPLMRTVKDLDPACLKARTGRKKTWTDKEFVNAFLAVGPKTGPQITSQAARKGISERTVRRYLKRLTENGLIEIRGDYYLKRDHGDKPKNPF